MIYFIAMPDRSRIKIGTTIRLSERLRQLCREHGDGLEVLAVIDGGTAEERALHRRFAEHRIVNEWFEPGDDLMGFIVSDGRPWDGSDERQPTAVTVKLDRALVGKAKLIATHRGIAAAELLSELLRVPIDRAYAQMLRELEAKP